MDIYAQIRRKLGEMAGGKAGETLFTAQVKSVEGETCTVLVGGLEVPDVLLTPADEGADGKLVITPRQGSMVTVADLSGGRLRRLAVVHWGEVEKIACTCDSVEFNGGDLGGLVKIEKLKKNLENLKSYVETMKSAVSSGLTGVGASTQANGANGASVFDGAMATQSIDFEDMEDTKIKH